MSRPVTAHLGKTSVFRDEYDPKLLDPVSRSLGRASFKLPTDKGFDLWRFYEITYLNRLSIPQTAAGYMKLDAASPYIVESKSLKLYIGSFTQTKFENLAEVREVMAHDLSLAVKSEVLVELKPLEESEGFLAPAPLQGTLIDASSGFTLDDASEVKPELLVKADGPRVEETLRSNVLRTLCPVTSQPDHAQVQIRYQGAQVNHLDLLRYLISFRKHQGFHEQCCEQIYHDLKTRLKLDKVEVMALFTRRGGIDINPVRSDFDLGKITVPRTCRQ